MTVDDLLPRFRDLSLHILDIAYNAVQAGATQIAISIVEDRAAGTISIAIADNGRGMTPAQTAQAAEPYFTSRAERSAGLGLPLFKRQAERTGGRLAITSAVGEGTTVSATFMSAHPGCPPPGDTANAVMLLAAAHPHIDFVYTHICPPRSYTFDTRAAKHTLPDGLPMNHARAVRLLTERIRGQLKEVRGE